MDIQVLKDEILRLNKLSREDEFKERIKRETFQNLLDANLIEFIEDTIDFEPCAIIFAMAYKHSLIEALAAYTLYIKKPNAYTKYLLSETSYEDVKEKHKAYFEWVDKEKDVFLPTIIRILCIQDEFKADAVSEWMNTDGQIANIEYKEYIQRVFPDNGIPKDRNITKNLQTFFKDMLMHEFDHSCPICKITMENMLIASHIRPFRDCCHVYEAFDNNNGLLLCKNHDALFDEGYITFDEKGNILFSSLLTHEERYQLRGVVLPEKYRTKNRMAYIAIHRDTIFQK